MLFKRLIIVAALLAVLPASASAQLFTISQIVGGHLYNPSATFTQNGGNIEIVLSENGDVADQNGHVLTGLFWEDSNGAAYGRVSAIPFGASTVRNDDNSVFSLSETPAQHQAYSTLGFGSFNQGIGMAGFSLFGDADAFTPGGNNPVINGVDWGLVSGFDPGGIGGNENPFIVNSEQFVLAGTLGTINHVRFQYGSSTTEQSFTTTGTVTTVPEGSSVAMFAGGLLPLMGGFLYKRRRTAKS